MASSLRSEPRYVALLPLLRSRASRDDDAFWFEAQKLGWEGDSEDSETTWEEFATGRWGREAVDDPILPLPEPTARLENSKHVFAAACARFVEASMHVLPVSPAALPLDGDELVEGDELVDRLIDGFVRTARSMTPQVATDVEGVTERAFESIYKEHANMDEGARRVKLLESVRRAWLRGAAAPTLPTVPFPEMLSTSLDDQASSVVVTLYGTGLESPLSASLSATLDGDACVVAPHWSSRPRGFKGAMVWIHRCTRAVAAGQSGRGAAVLVRHADVSTTRQESDALFEARYVAGLTRAETPLLIHDGGDAATPLLDVVTAWKKRMHVVDAVILCVEQRGGRRRRLMQRAFLADARGQTQCVVRVHDNPTHPFLVHGTTGDVASATAGGADVYEMPLLAAIYDVLPDANVQPEEFGSVQDALKLDDYALRPLADEERNYVMGHDPRNVSESTRRAALARLSLSVVGDVHLLRRDVWLTFHRGHCLGFRSTAKGVPQVALFETPSGRVYRAKPRQTSHNSETFRHLQRSTINAL